MAWYQWLLFRKKNYRRRVSQDDYDKRAHKRNIRAKQMQIKRAQWGVCYSLWLVPFSGMLTGVNAVRHTRNLHIATQKLHILQEQWNERYPGEEVAPPQVKPPILKRVVDGVRRPCGHVCGCIADDVDDEMDDIGSDVVENLERSVLGGDSLNEILESNDSEAAYSDIGEKGRRSGRREVKRVQPSPKTMKPKARDTSKGSKTA